jgi:hypothetical protein
MGDSRTGWERVPATYTPAHRRTGRKDWTGYEFTPAMIDTAQKHEHDTSSLWSALRESGYLAAAIAAGGGEIPLDEA